MTRAAILCRMSLDRTGEALGVERQLKADTELCVQRDWTVVATFIENDTSATKGKRPKLAALLKMVTDGQVDVIVVWHIDRLVRRLDELERVINLCEAHGVKIATVTGDLDLSTDAGRLVARILASVARGEVERKSARQLARNEQAANAGEWSGGPRAFGYTADGMHLDPVEAPIVAELYRQFLAGSTLGGLTRWVNDKGIQTPKGNPWRYNSLREMLANPRNAGLRGVRRLKPNGQGGRERWHDIVGPAQWSGIVDEPTWRATMAVIMDPARRVNLVGNGRRYLLSNLALCGAPDCGKPLITGRRDGIRTLRCPTLAHVSRRADYIEDYVTKTIFTRLREDDAIDLCQRPVDGPNLAGLRDEEAAIRQRLRGLAEDYILLGMDRQQMAAASEAARKRLAAIDEVVAAAGRVDVVAQMVVPDRDPADIWHGLALDVQRALVATLMASIRVLPGRSGRPGGVRFDPASVELTWRRPGNDAEAKSISPVSAADDGRV